MKNLFWILSIFFSISMSAQMEVDGEILYGNEWIDYTKSYVKVTVNKDGIYRLTREELSAQGIPTNQISLQNLEIFNFGKSIGFYVDKDEAFIEFYGKRSRIELDQFIYADPSEILNPEYSAVSDEAAYFITWNETINPLLYTERIIDLSSNSLEPESFYFHEEMVVETVEHYKPTYDSEEVRFSNCVSSEGYGTGLNNINFVDILINNFVENQGAPELEVRFGANRTAHVTEVRLNDDVLDTLNNNKTDVVVRKYTLSADQMTDTLKFSLKGLLNPKSDKSIIANVKVTYPRAFEITNNSLALTIEEASTERYFEIAGYQGSALPIIYDLTSAVRIVAELTSENKIGFTMPASTEKKQLLVLNPVNGYQEPVSVEKRDFVDYSDGDYNYIMITNADLRNQGSTDWVQEYANYRQSDLGGAYDPIIANVDQLYDQYAYGVNRHFIALRNFGYWTKVTYSSPEFMFIIGKGREYRENRTPDQIQENVDAYVPTWGIPGSDNMILASNESPKPIYPVGRLAAKNAQEIEAYFSKVKEHEQNNTSPHTIDDRHWQKRVLHLSGGDATLQVTLANNLAIMEDTLENNMFGAEVTTFYKKSIEAIEETTSKRIFELINNGLSIITFFGHSSVGKFDFSLDNIDEYSNKGRYPLVFSLGCYSGNIHTPVEGISEQFIVRKDKGAICFIAASGTAYVGEQFQYGVKFYDRLGNEDYGQPLGEILTNVIDDFSDKTGYTYVTLFQQLTLHGDPAIRIASFETPDLIPDPASVKTNPTFVDTYEDEFELCFDVANIGKSVRGEYDIFIEHYDPKGNLVTDTILRREIPIFNASYCLNLPVSSNQLVGKNTINITVDYSNEIEELPNPEAEINNKLISTDGTLGFDFYILNNSAIPVFPKEYAIVNSQEVSLVASTYNAFGDDQKFTIQIDTTEEFNSPLFREKDIVNVKGLMEWKLDFPLENNTVYYWRTSPDSTTTGVGYVWSESSFVYEPSSRSGWNQSHYYQFLENDYVNMTLDEDRSFYFVKNIKEIVISNKNHEPGNSAQFRIDNGHWSEAYRRASGPALAVTVFDTLGRFYKNDVGGEYGSFNPYPVPIITYYYKTDNQQSRIDFIDFLENHLPDKFYACVYNIIRDENSDFNVEEWAADSLANNGKNIFNFLEAQGSIEVRNLEKINPLLPWGFIYQKGVSPLAEGIAETLDETVEVVEELPGFWFEGRFSSDFIGPANSWDELEWVIDESTQLSFDTSLVRVIGYDINKTTPTILFDSISSKSLDLSSVDATEFPYLSVDYFANDFFDVSPVQLEQLRVYFEGYADVAVNTTQNYSFYADSLQQGDVLKLVYDISNFSPNDLGAIDAEYRIIDESNNVITEKRTLPELEAGASKTIDFSYDTRQLLGEYQFQMELNIDRNPTEEYYFNNFGLESFKVTPDKINPLLNVTFDGITIMDQDIVSSKPVIIIELSDENEYILLENPDNFTILLTDPSGEISQITADNPDVAFFPAQEGEENKSKVEFTPELVIDGEYKLTIEARDESDNNSGDQSYEVRFRVYNEEMVSNVFNYPNPFSTSTQFVFTLTGDEEPGNILIRIMTLTGKVVREITAAELGPTRIGVNRTEYKWDGRDEFGDKLGNGTYLYQVITKKLDGSDYKHFSDPTQNNTDYLFKKGFGKMVIIR